MVRTQVYAGRDKLDARVRELDGGTDVMNLSWDRAWLVVNSRWAKSRGKCKSIAKPR